MLPVFLFFTWFVEIVACAAEKAVDGARRGLPEGKRGGVSILPGIVIFPLVFWGIALLIDLVVEPWGTWGIGLFHGVFLVLMIASIVRNWFRLRSLEKDT
jgi:uncharacterized membrane protein YcjF (UPF0283 family)